MTKKAYVVTWLCGACGNIHTGVAIDRGDGEFQKSRALFEDDCKSKNEEYAILELPFLPRNEETVKSPLDTFLETLESLINPDLN